MLVNFNNEIVEVFGRQVEIGSTIDSCLLIKSDFSKMDILKSKSRKIIYSLTSLDDKEYCKTIEELNKFAVHSDLDVIVVTVDTQYTISSIEEKYPNITFYTDYMYLNFAAKFGVLLEKYRLLVEAIFIINEENSIENFEYCTFEEKFDIEKLKEF